ncbi:MAG TPA: TolC family protein [Candidatus Binatia bacterium]|nr:TolC family protein [Candidatus Binatia bacterium]
MKKTLLLLLLASGILPAAKVPLSQAVANAWKISPGIDSQRLEKDAATIARLTALRQKYFSVHFYGSYRYSSDRVEVTLSDFPFPVGAGLAPDTTVLSAPRDNVDLKMSLFQPLYSGGMLSNAAGMEAVRAAAEGELLRLKKIEMAGKVKKSFYSHRLFSRKRDSLNLLLDTLKLHQDRLENLYREELVRRSDLLETRARADEIRLSLLDLEQLIEAEALHFKMLCGYEPDAIAADPLRPGADSVETAMEFLLARHPLLGSLDERARIVQLQKRSISASRLPQVHAVLELHYGRPGQNFFADQWKLYALGALNVSLPVFDWNRAGRDKKLADIAACKLENQRSDFIRESEKNLRQLFAEKKSLGKKFVLLDGLVANAAEDAGLKEKLYEENQIDHNDYLAALTGHERYLANRDELLAQMELIEVGIQTLIGKCEEER